MGETPPTNAVIEKTILTLLNERGDDKTICPSDVARQLAGSNEKEWRLLMKPIRAVAVDMTKQDKIAIKRKGKIVDPDAFKGVYRLGSART